MISIIARYKSPKSFIAMKAAVGQFINGRKTGMKSGESAAPRKDTIWPSDTEESSFASIWRFSILGMRWLWVKGNCEQGSSSNGDKFYYVL